MADDGGGIVDVSWASAGGKGVWKAAILRWLVLVLVALPAVIGGIPLLSQGPGRMPYFTASDSHPGLVRVMRLSDGFPSAAYAWAAASLLLGVLTTWILTGGTIAWFLTLRTESGWRKTWGAVWGSGLRLIAPMARVTAMAIVVSIAGAGLLNLVFRTIGDYGRDANWDAYRLVLILPGIRMAVMAAWFSLVGAWALWLRWVLLADNRRIYRRAGWLVCRLWFRFPLLAPLPCLAVALLLGVFPGSLFLIFPRFDNAGFAMQAAGWLLIMLIYSVAWTSLFPLFRRIYPSAATEDLRAMPDAPWHVVMRLRNRARKLFGRRPPPSPGDVGSAE